MDNVCRISDLTFEQLEELHRRENVKEDTMYHREYIGFLNGVYGLWVFEDFMTVISYDQMIKFFDDVDKVIEEHTLPTPHIEKTFTFNEDEVMLFKHLLSGGRLTSAENRHYVIGTNLAERLDRMTDRDILTEGK